MSFRVNDRSFCSILLYLPLWPTHPSWQKRYQWCHWEVLSSIRFEWLIPVKPSISSLQNILPLLIFTSASEDIQNHKYFGESVLRSFQKQIGISVSPGMSLELCHKFQDSCYTYTSIKLFTCSSNKIQMLFLCWCLISEVIVPFIQASVLLPINMSRNIFPITERRG